MQPASWIVDRRAVQCRIKGLNTRPWEEQRHGRANARGPKPTPETQHFWDGTQAGELRLQRCDACANVYFPPRPFCPACASRKVSVFKASGKGKLYSYVIHHRPAARLHPALCDRGSRARRRSADDDQHRRLSADSGSA